MALQELRSRRSKLMTDAAKLIQSKDVTQEQRDQFDRMMVDVDATEADIAREERIEKYAAEQRAATRPPYVHSDDAQGSDSERRALLNYLKTGEARDLLTTGSGAALIPERLYTSIIQSQKAWGALASAVKQDNGPAGPVKIPLSDDRTNNLTPASEPDTFSEADPLLSSVESNTQLMKTQWVKYSLQLLNRSGFDLDGFIQGLFNKRFWRGVTQVMSTGSGTAIQSIYSTAALGATSNSASSVGYLDLVNLLSSLEEAYQNTASFCMSSTVRNSLLGVTDTIGRPLFTSAVDGGFDRILGKPIIINNYAPVLAAASRSILYGDFSEGYLLRLPNAGLSLYRSAERFIDTAEIGLIGFAEVGGTALNAGDNPIVALQQAAS